MALNFRVLFHNMTCNNDVTLRQLRAQSLRSRHGIVERGVIYVGKADISYSDQEPGGLNNLQPSALNPESLTYYRYAYVTLGL